MSKERGRDRDLSQKNAREDDTSTVELDKYSLLRQVGYDSAAPKTEQKTLRMPVPDSFPTVPMPAVNFEHLKAGTQPIDTDMIVEIDVELEPLDDYPTSQIPVRMEFDAIVEPGGVLRIPKQIMDSGHVRPGMLLRIIAAQKE